MDKPSALTRREQADAGALHILRCVAIPHCPNCLNAAAALAAAWPVKVYQLSEKDEDNVFLVRAATEWDAWVWLTANEGCSLPEVQARFDCSEAVINEAL